MKTSRDKNPSKVDLKKETSLADISLPQMLIYASPQNKKSNIPKKRTLRTKALLRCNNIHAQKEKKKAIEGGVSLT